MIEANSQGHAPTQPEGTFATSFRALGGPEGLSIELDSEFERLCNRLGFAPTPESNRIDDRYRIEQTLGQGSMGVVLRAWDERLGRRVAVKLVRVRTSVNVSPLQARLQREAQMLARVDHPNVISVYDVGSDQGRVYLAMQYVAGVTVRKWQRAEPRSPNAVLDVYLQAARGLEAAHAGGVIHRDFKPDNMIVGDDGIVRVLDFGIAAALQVQSPEDEATLSSDPADSDEYDRPPPTATHDLPPLTRTGAILGTLAYMAPEQLRLGGGDEHSDQFAFCVALFEALAGKRPFALESQQRSPLNYASAIEHQTLETRALPRWLRPILTKGLSRDPATRFASMSALIKALEHGRRRRRQVRWAGVVTLGLAPAVLAGSLLAAPASERESCDEFIGQVGAVWGDEQRAALDKFSSVDPQAVAYVQSTLDTLADGWRGQAQAQCDGEFAPPKDDPRRVCTQTWLTSFERNVALLVERGDLQTLVHAPDLLATLSNSGDFCERAPSQPVDPELFRLVQAAREAALVGDPELADSLAEQALERAKQEVGTRSYTPELAEAHAARASVAFVARDFVRAEAACALAERQAIGAGHWSVLLPTYTKWAKALAFTFTGNDTMHELATSHLERALALADQLALNADDLRRVELVEVRGLIARSADRQTEAIEHHQRARVSFVSATQPVLAAGSLNNIGANHQELGQYDLATEAYREALDLLTTAGVSERHPILLDVEINLGLMAMVELDAAGLPYLLNVARLHPSPIQSVRARIAASILAYGTDRLDLAVELAEQALRELATQADAPPDLLAEVELTAGVCLASKGDPRGERLVHAAERHAEASSVAVQFRTAQTWIAWLEENDRCEEFRARLETLDLAMQDYDTTEFNYAQWRSDQSESPCLIPTGE